MEKESMASRLDPGATVGSLVVSPPVSILAIGGTQQLSLSALSLSGAAITALDSVWYRLVTAADTARIRLSPQGLATGLAVSSAPILVNAFAFQNGSVVADRALMQVTSSVVAGLTLSIQPTAPDSAKQAIGLAKTIVPVLRNPATGANLANPAMKYQVKRNDAMRVAVYTPDIAFPQPTPLGSGTLLVQKAPLSNPGTNQIVPLVGEGSAWVYARVSAYGALLQDSVLYAFSYPYAFSIATGKNQLDIQNDAAGQIITLAPGATATFRAGIAATDPLTMTYTFDNPSAATAATPPASFGGTSGNVTTLIGGQTSTRKFTTPGTYQWTVTTSGGPAPWTGRILTGTLMIK